LPPSSTPFPYTTLFRSAVRSGHRDHHHVGVSGGWHDGELCLELHHQFGFGVAGVPGLVKYSRAAIECQGFGPDTKNFARPWAARSEEHTSELQSRFDLV